jgi:hypothetical protein
MAAFQGFPQANRLALKANMTEIFSSSFLSIGIGEH